MSEKTNRHQRRPSQGVFVFPDNLSDPFPKNDAEESKVAALGSTPAVAHPPLTVEKGDGLPVPPPPAKSLEEMSTDNSRK
ncbi:hypothetical protein ACH5RR_004835 [Cinchona calisaya]|uniref:Uncharacterized protein n=1 Tax=Cinchona calisaya TaxID=153742 RepID=A0ABD3AZH7_9GENT